MKTKIKIKRADGLTQVRVRSDMTIYTAAELKGKLLKALQGAGEAMEIDLSEVSELDTAGLQLLLLLGREADRLGKRLRVVGHSAATSAVFGIYNITSYFAGTAATPPGTDKEQRA